MREEQSGVGRRKFLKTGLQATAGAVALGGGMAKASLPTDKKISMTGRIPERPFGKTGHVLPILGHGGSAMVKAWISLSNCELLSEEDRVAMVRHGYDKGIRYFDTAREYGESEGIMGKALKDVRDDVYIASKIWAWTPETVRQSVETSLKELDTDYVDCMQIHGPLFERLSVPETMALHAELVKLRDEGLFRFIGITTHVEFKKAYEMLRTGGFDQVLLARGYFNKGLTQILSNQNMEWREMCIAEAHERQMGIVNMKVFGYFIMGHNASKIVPDFDPEGLKKLPAAAIRWALQDERFNMFNIGVSIPGDIDTNVALFNGDLTLTAADRRLLAEFSEKAYSSPMVKSFKVV